MENHEFLGTFQHRATTRLGLSAPAFESMAFALIPRPTPLPGDITSAFLKPLGRVFSTPYPSESAENIFKKCIPF